MPDTVRDPASVARRFVQARLTGVALERYPGEAPADLASAYAVQDAAIAMWPDEVAGWKVGLVQDAQRARFGAERIAGPIFRKQIARADRGAVTELPVIRSGFAAVEAELVLVVRGEPPAGQTRWTPQQADTFAGAMHVGVELAGSPFSGINDFGPAVTASDFGNNAGLVLGGEIPEWRRLPLECLCAEMQIDGVSVGRGAGAGIPGGPLAAFAFVLGQCAERGLELGEGDLVSTGAITGVHAVEPGQDVRVDFGPWGVIACRTVDAAQASTRAASG